MSWVLIELYPCFHKVQKEFVEVFLYGIERFHDLIFDTQQKIRYKVFINRYIHLHQTETD